MTYERTATACASSAWKPWPPLTAPHDAGDSDGVTSATYWPRASSFTARAALLELAMATSDPRTEMMPELGVHNWSTSEARLPSEGNGAGVTGAATGEEAADATCVHGPAHPPPAGLVSTNHDGTPPVTDSRNLAPACAGKGAPTPVTVNGEPDVTMRSKPSFSVMSTLIVDVSDAPGLLDWASVPTVVLPPPVS